MAFSENEKIQELKMIRDFLNEVEIASEVLEKGKVAEETSIVVCLPSVEDAMEGDEVNPEKLHVASGYLLDLDDTQQRLAKYLMFYTQIKADISAMTTAEVLLLLNELNRTVRVGHYFLGNVEDEEMPVVQYRATVTGAIGEPFDQGIVADTIIEMGVAFDSVSEVLAMANEECKSRKGN